MPERLIHRIVGRALTEPAFRERLLQRPREAIRSFGLSEREYELIASVRAGSLQEFAREVSARLEEELRAAQNGNGRGARDNLAEELRTPLD